MTRVEAAEVVLEIQDVRVQEFDAPRRPLSALEERSRVLASVTFKIGGLDVAAWVERSVGDVDLSSWIQSLTVLLLDLRTPGGRHLLFEHETEDPLVLHRRGRRLSVHVGGREIAACSHAELQAAVEAALASVQAKLEAAGERGKLYWADAHDVLDPGWVDLEEGLSLRHGTAGCGVRSSRPGSTAQTLSPSGGR